MRESNFNDHRTLEHWAVGAPRHTCCNEASISIEFAKYPDFPRDI